MNQPFLSSEKDPLGITAFFPIMRPYQIE